MENRLDGTPTSSLCGAISYTDSTAFFLDHLRNITSLTFKAPKEAPIGLTGRYHVPFRLKRDHSPKLKTLHLEYMLLDIWLQDFLVHKAGTLETVHLRNCSAEIYDGVGESGIHWHELFDAISSARPRRLHTFGVSEDRPAPALTDQYDRDWYVNRSPDEERTMVSAQIEETRSMLEGGGKRVWPHVNANDDHGFILEDEVGNYVSFREGRDQEAFERLMEIVIGNNGVNEAFLQNDNLDGL